MGRTIELSGDWLRLALYALQLGGVVLVLLFVIPRGESATLPLALLFGALGVATVYGLWHQRTDSDGSPKSRTAEDITYDPIADPGQAARHRWEKTVRRLPGGDDDGD